MTINYKDLIATNPNFYKDAYKRLVFAALALQIVIILLTGSLLLQSNMTVKNRFFLTYLSGGIKKINPSY